MRKASFLTLGIIGVAASHDAIATNHFHSGIDCRWAYRATNAPFSAVGYSEAGIANLSTSSQLTMVCPIIESKPSGPPSLVGTQVTFRDNNGSLGGDVACHGVAMDSAGNTTIGATRYSCSMGGGCTSPPISGYASTAGTASTLILLATGTGWTSYSIECTLPVKVSGSSSSYILNYVIVY